MKPQSFFAYLVIGLSLFWAGCNSAVKPDSVIVSVANLKAAELTATETRLVMTVRFTSESLNAFGFAGSSHKLFLNGSYVGRALSNTPLGLPPLSTTTQDMPLVVENAAFVRQVMAANGNPVVSYRLETVLFTKSGDDDMRVKSAFEGSIDLRSIERAQ